MINKLQDLIQDSLTTLKIKTNEIIITHSKDKKFGDFSSNIALMLAKKQQTNPHNLAQDIIKYLPTNNLIIKTEIAGAGFINFFINQEKTNAIIDNILNLGSNFGQCNFGKNKKILLEFVSANPTGPLHIGHGRGASFGATLSNLLTTVGFKVTNEYYVNDGGRQMDILTTSVYLRYVKTQKFPDNGYHGDYVYNIAQLINDIKKEDIFQNVCKDEKDGGDKEQHIDDLIANCKKILQKDYDKISTITSNYILQDIKDDLINFGVKYQQFFSEKSLNNSVIKKIIAKLQQSNDVYLTDGTLWFNSTKYGDEKDRVIMRKNGAYTYFATDIAYHLDKYNRGYDEIINIWGSDHHGYITRVKSSIIALKMNANKLKILLVQFANLYKNGVKIPMSTRSGSFVTLKQLVTEVGIDAARFFYILRKADQHLDFDLDLAVSKTNENPVFYIQYAHARICSVLNKANTLKKPDLSLLTNEYELILIKELNRYQDVLLNSAKQYEPHQLAYYLKDLAGAFHSYYNNCEFLITNDNLQNARLNLIKAVKQIIYNGMKILGVSSPQKM